MVNGLELNFPLKENDYLVIDGGFSSQLKKYVSDIDNDPLWTARSVVDHPNHVIQVHKDFLKAGCRIILTASYQASIDGFAKYLHLSRDEAVAAFESSVRLAKKAIEESGGTPGHSLVGGSVGPYGACLHDGSEYTGAYLDTVSPSQLKDWHLPRIRALVDAGADFLAVETLPCWREAMSVMDAVMELGGIVSLWLSFTLKDAARLSSGETIVDAIRNLKKHELFSSGRLFAIGFNCCNPLIVKEALSNVRQCVKKMPLVVYPNSGEVWDGSRRCWTGDAVSWTELVPEWLELGVVGVGGCCRVSAEAIPAIRASLLNAITRGSKK